MTDNEPAEKAGDAHVDQAEKAGDAHVDQAIGAFTDAAAPRPSSRTRERRSSAPGGSSRRTAESSASTE
jgi:hypothetical protein